ncbi:MAG: hypothetical protein K9M03_03570 [Kiritimatiellales bacterium]|nr:hypothetical protein [Kiritimatiellales bacterium]
MSEEVPQRHYKLFTLIGEKHDQLVGTRWDIRHRAMASLMSPLMKLGSSIMVSDINPTKMTAVVSGTREDIANIINYFSGNDNLVGEIQDMPKEDGKIEGLPTAFLEYNRNLSAEGESLGCEDHQDPKCVHEKSSED